VKARFAAVLFLVYAAQAPAQVLPSVDIDTARTQIDQFLQENELILDRIESLVTTNEELTADMELRETWLSGVNDVAGRIVEEADRLTDILSELASKALTTRAQQALERYRNIKTILDKKIRELSERIEAAKASIERNTTVVEELREKIQSNLDNVELLKAAIERSAGSEEIINGYIENLEKALDEAQDLINRLF